MAIVIVTTPVEGDSYWVATESPVVFGLQRKDRISGAGTNQINATKDVGGFLTISIATFTNAFANEGETIVLHDATTDTFMIGTVTDLQDDGDYVTDIPWVAGTVIDFANGNDYLAGYYFQAQLTINDVVNTLLIKASPNVNGYADVDISPILQTVILPGKSGAETGSVAAENNKSGRFEVEFRECWYGSSEAYEFEPNTWNYAEFVRSSRQGSNLEEYIPVLVSESPAGTFNYDNPICNLFEKPVYTVGLPFSLSFLQGMAEEASPPVTESVIFVLKQYDAAHNLLDTDTVTVAVISTKSGRLCSFNILPSRITNPDCDYCTVELTSKRVE